MEYALHLFIIVCIYASLAVALQMLIGHSGLFSVAQAGIFGLGAYASSLLEARLGIPIGFASVAAAATAGGVCYLLARLLVKLKREEFFLASLAIQVAIISILTNVENLTGGALGLSGIEPFSSDSLHNKMIAAILVVVLLCATVWMVRRVAGSSLGRILRAARDDEPAAFACGKDVSAARRCIFVAVGVVAGAAGSLYANYVTAIDPTSFSISESILLVSIVVVGGSENMLGTLSATALLILVPEAFRYLPLPTSAGQELRQILFGCLFLFVVCRRPEGILQKRLDSRPNSTSKGAVSRA